MGGALDGGRTSGAFSRGGAEDEVFETGWGNIFSARLGRGGGQIFSDGADGGEFFQQVVNFSWISSCKFY